jgi:hypothetical protein
VERRSTNRLFFVLERDCKPYDPFLVSIRILEKHKGKRVEGEWFYEGEMRVKFGKREWARMKAKGKFESMEESDSRVK